MKGLREIRRQSIEAAKRAGTYNPLDLWPGDPGFEEQQAERERERLNKLAEQRAKSCA